MKLRVTQYRKSVKQRASSLKKINKIGKPLAKKREKKRERMQIVNISNKIRYVTTDSNAISRIIREYYKQLYKSKLENLDKINYFLEKLQFITTYPNRSR